MVLLQEWRRRRYVWKCVAAVVWGSCTVMLELLDFPPILWLVDAHALWHLSTVPIPLLWYRYETDNSLCIHYVVNCSFLTDDASYEAELLRKIV